MAGKKNGHHLSEEALPPDDARVPAPAVGDRLLDVKLAFDGWCERRKIARGSLKEQIHASVQASLAKKKKGAKS